VDQTDAANITTCCVTAAVASFHLVMPLAPGAAWHPRGQCDAKAASISAMGSYQLQRSHHLSRLPHLERMFWIRMYLYFQHPIIVGHDSKVDFLFLNAGCPLQHLLVL